jgi:phosphoribosyl 1,2-cyclic phosphodiesterase
VTPKSWLLISTDAELTQRLTRNPSDSAPFRIIAAPSFDGNAAEWKAGKIAGVLVDEGGNREEALKTLYGLSNHAGHPSVPRIGLNGQSSAASVQALFEAGATEVIPRNWSKQQLMRAIQSSDRFDLYFWGVRGTLPVSGRNTLKYGGCTSSISLRIGLDRHFIFDAGTGLRNLSRYLMLNESGQFNGRLLITHPHWDHLNCIPFFEPLYQEGNHIYLMGPPHEGHSFRSLLEGQMNGIYFPIHPDRFRADVHYRDIREGTYHLDGVLVRAFRLDHPGCCLGYRVDYAGSSIAYITDNELRDGDRDQGKWDELVEFIRDVDVLIHDTSYFDHEYESRLHWGHSSISQVVELAAAASVKKLFLFHHDPEHTDKDIDAKLLEAQSVIESRQFKLDCLNARQGEIWDLRQGQRRGMVKPKPSRTRRA